MTFERLQTTITYLLVGITFLVLLLSGELPGGFWAIATPVVLLSIPFGTDPRFGRPAFWNLFLLAALATILARASATGEWLLGAVYFCSLMVMAKLFQRQQAKDLFQLYALSLLQLVGGAVINPTLSFAVCFLLYVVFLVWALVVLHLRREIEALAEDGGEPARFWRVRRILGPGFLAGTSVLALVIFFLSIGVFLFFPRLGLGLFGHQTSSGASVSGFSNTIQLGHFGTLKQDQTVIMRIELPGADPASALPLRLKGISFDKYLGNTWTKTRRNLTELRFQENDFWLIHDTDKAPRKAPELVQRVYLEQIEIGTKTIFGVARMRGVHDLRSSRWVTDRRKVTRFYEDDDLDVRYDSPAEAGPLRYEVRSVLVAPNPEALRVAGTDYPRDVRRYKRLPKELDPRIAVLAREIVAGAENPYDQASAIEKYLLASYAYSLEGGHDEKDPLADFLFGRKSGHCEFFSTAFVVLARSLGLPARPVGGFYGGEHNTVGNYIAIRQADAHAWAEVYFPGAGWTVFDATPPSGALAPAPTGFWAAVRQAIDSLQLLWYKWVIRWDLERQLAFLRSIGEKLSSLKDLLPGGGGSGSGSGGEGSGVLTRLLAGLRTNAGTVVALAAVLFLTWIAWRRRRHSAPRNPTAASARTDRDARAARALYDAVLRLVKRRGVTLSPSATPGAVLRALGPAAAEHARPAVSLYEAVVFGGEAVDPDALRKSRAALRGLR